MLRMWAQVPDEPCWGVVMVVGAARGACWWCVRAGGGVQDSRRANSVVDGAVLGCVWLLLGLRLDGCALELNSRPERCLKEKKLLALTPVPFVCAPLV
jgi:hypothetical protein